jgi:hypothetical protein
MRAGLLSNVRFVRGLALGPMNGRQPTVCVIATASRIAITSTVVPVTFDRRANIRHLLTSKRSPTAPKGAAHTIGRRLSDS